MLPWIVWTVIPAGIFPERPQTVLNATFRITTEPPIRIMPLLVFLRIALSATRHPDGSAQTLITPIRSFRLRAHILHCYARIATAAGSTPDYRRIVTRVTHRITPPLPIRAILPPAFHRTALSVIRHPDGLVPNTSNIQVSPYTADVMMAYGRHAAIVIRLPATTGFFPAWVVTGGRRPIHTIPMSRVMYTTV